MKEAHSQLEASSEEPEREPPLMEYRGLVGDSHSSRPFASSAVSFLGDTGNGAFALNVRPVQVLVGHPGRADWHGELHGGDRDHSI